MSEYLDFMRQRLGANWVLARRTDRVIRQYGADVNCVSKKQLRQVELDYRAEFGDPYDKPRALMYLALKAVVDDWHADGRNFLRKEPEHLPLVRAAIKAEQERL